MRRASLVVAAILSIGDAPAPVERMPNAEDLDACRFLAATDNSNSLPSAEPLKSVVVSKAAFDIDGDGRPEQLGVVHQGTAHYESVTVAKDGKQPKGLAWVGEEEFDEDARWMHSERWLIHNGHAYIVRFAGLNAGYPRYVSRVTKSIAEKPVCRLEPIVSKYLFPGSAASDPRVCEALKQGKVEYISPGRTLPTAPDSDPEPITRVDFENNGRPRDLRLSRIDGTAGSGCTQRYFAILGDDSSPAARRLYEVQHEVPEARCRDAEPRWFRFEGKVYLESRSEGANAPPAEFHEKHNVDLFVGDHARRVCTADYGYHGQRIVGVWSGSGWRAP